MSTPTLISLKKEALKARDLTFMKWLKKETSIYISSQAMKYAKAEQDSQWMPVDLSCKLFNRDITQAEFDEAYEQHVRDTLWEQLPTLAGLEMGCWCEDAHLPKSGCHGQILIRLYDEYTRKEEEKMKKASRGLRK